MVELVDTSDSKSDGESCASSNLATRTKKMKVDIYSLFYDANYTLENLASNAYSEKVGKMINWLATNKISYIIEEDCIYVYELTEEQYIEFKLKFL